MPKGDRVVILEDTDKDGRADKSSVFIQEPTLVAPLGIAVIDNQIIVSNAPDLIVYTDVNRDLKFDAARRQARSAAHGFDGRNHDHALHSVTFGPDGRWYFSQGNAGAHFTDRGGKTFRVGSTYDPVPDGGAQPVFGNPPPTYSGAKSDDGHVYVGGFSARMQPDGTGVEILGFNFRNSYEQTITSFGDIFHNDNDDPPACRTTLAHGVRQPRLVLARRQALLATRIAVRARAFPRRSGARKIPASSRRAMSTAAARPRASCSTKAMDWARSTAGCCCRPRRRATPSLDISRRPKARATSSTRFDFLTSNAGAGVRGHGLQGRQGQQRDPDLLPALGRGGGSGWRHLRRRLVRSARGRSRRQGRHHLGRHLPHRAQGIQIRACRRSIWATLEGQITALRSPAVNVRALGFNALVARAPRPFRRWRSC